MAVSSRLLRKFQKDNLSQIVQEENGDLEDFPVHAHYKEYPNTSRYDLLHDESHSESEVKEDDDEADISSRVAQHHSRASTKRKKKRKKRKSLSSSGHKHSSEDIDEIERTVREVNALLGVSDELQHKSTEKAPEVEKNILYIEKKHLNPKNELKRMFGSKTVLSAQEGRVNKGRNRGPIKNFWFVTYRDHWSSLRQNELSLSMVLAEKKDGCQYFNYVHNTEYQTVEKIFLQSVESMNPDQLMEVLNAHPFHVNTLLQVSEMIKISEEFSMAATLIERALYTLESAFHPLFNLSKGNCRLDYRRQENRSLFIVLFNHLTFVGQRACYRTALELCKVLLSLNPEVDPLAIVLAMDFYAIRAKEYSWFLEFIEKTDPQRNVLQLPNIAFGQAMATYLVGNKEKADLLLQDTLLMYPGVLLPLLDKCSISPDPKTLACSYFADYSSKQSHYLTQLSELYVGRSFHLWKSAEMMKWLEFNTLKTLDLIAKKDPRVSDYTKKREKRYLHCFKTPLPVSRHIFLSDIKGVPIYEQGSTFNFDPLPPHDSVNLYAKPSRPTVSDRFNIVSLFFRSFLPTFNREQPDLELPEELNGELDEAAGGEDNSSSASLHRSVATLLDAMRDLISNLQLPQDADGESTNSNENVGDDENN